jgi:predicted nucleic acid-binding protein
LLSPNFAEALPQIATHNFVTDAFLVSLARHHRGKLATLDRPFARLYPGTVELVQ